MKTYQSHKVVQAAKIKGFQFLPDSRPAKIALEFEGDDTRVEVDWSWLVRHADSLTTMEDVGHKLIGGYYVIYPDGFTSWSPAKSFEEGYSEPDQIAGLPVAGYKPTQNASAVDLVNFNKEMEERALRRLDELDNIDDVDTVWIQLGREYLEKGWMCVNRAIFRPGRISLPEDAASE